MTAASDVIDLADIRRRLAGAKGRRFWRGLEEVAETDEVRRFIEAEFPSIAALMPNANRREFLRLMAASMMLGGLAACGDMPDEKALPYVKQPERIIPGKPRFYATAIPFEGFAQPVLAETHVGRPTKLEGNPDHPMSDGATDAFTQAAILQLYDPDRSQAVAYMGRISTWGSFEAAIVGLRAQLQETRGAGLRILTDTITSPTLARQFDEIAQAFPAARVHHFEPIGHALRHAGTQLAFGAPFDVHHRLDRATVIASFEEDLLGAGPAQVRNAAAWAIRRQALQGSGKITCLYVAESTPTPTGAMATDRRAVAAARVPILVAALAGELKLNVRSANVASSELGESERAWIRAVADELTRQKGRSLVAVGAHQPPEAQALGHLINYALGNVGATVFFSDPIAMMAPDGERSLAVLTEDIAAGRVDILLILSANPAYTAPVDLSFGEHLNRVPLRVHAGVYSGETAALCHWHVPLTHPLESWSDARAVDGTATILQPAVKPLYNGRSIHDVLALLLGRSGDAAYDLVRETWLQNFGDDDFEARWRQTLHDGFVSGSAAAVISPRPTTAKIELKNIPSDQNGLEVVFRPDPSVWDGRFANSGWLQELPKTLTKLTWDNIVAISPRLAEELKLANGDEVEVEADGRFVRAPAWILPGQAERTVTIFLGYGRWRAGRVGDGIGYNGYALRTTSAPWIVPGTKLRPTGPRVELAVTQHHFRMRGEDFVRIMSPEEARSPKAPQPTQPSFYPKWDYPKYAWAMAIDLDLCIGCNTCVVACQAENNIPVVGKEQVLNAREMHWLRVDRYYAGDLDQPKTYFQPVPCMHCEQAPCEMGCPVNATVHGPEGLNEMIYNRCIGTRTCASYCPYKVRRFNYFEYSATDAPSIEALRNPNVTVRARGVMEKCTYCVQRISAARIEAKKEDRAIRDGEVKTACQAVCPTQAIVFGDQNDPESAVSKRKQSPRNYALLEELNTQPRTTYQARIVRHNPGEGEG